MSVINEMLKDLDKRKADEQALTTGQYQSRAIARTANKSLTTIIIAVVITASICIAAMYLLLPYMNAAPSTPATIDKALTTSKTKVKQQAIATEVVVPTSKVLTEQVTPKVIKSTTDIVANEYVNITSTEIINTAQKPKAVIAKAKPVAIVESNGTSIEKPKVDKSVRKDSSLVISKVELTPEQLSNKKLSIAKRALKNGQLKKAESLLEEAIILQPYHVEARKELAALWFGRKTYQPAKNLLTQGVVLLPNNEDFRLMLARIYSTEGNNEKAFKVLNELASSNLLEYQLALASMASQSDHHSSAINAYNKLLVMRPQQSRWWLALAISYDSNEQYQPATSAYQKAIALGRLSSNSVQFAKQRLIELGE
ncbi:tetratricopeptide repeat protein [Thalassotalea fonticola]|uniref:Tetratricopeptide repeat protein n=1 Tax=Thalassotalea fonticola TaxID=3065649 RepID=A0ABZ0GJA1_9GAMM|nr:tetratricopeptide repeat protein [Colwelliaceae bacterium S1-1]